MADKRGRIYERDGRFYVDIKMPDGSRFRRSSGKQLKTARSVLSRKREEIREWEETNAPGTFAACWSHYLKRLSIEGKKTSVATAAHRRKHWAKFERRRVATVTQTEIDQAIDDLPLTPGGKNNCIRFVRAALNRGKRDNLIGEIPFHFSQRKHVVKLPVLITNADFGLLLRAVNQAATYHHVRSRAITLLYLGFYGGLRHSEALHLEVSDIDFPDRKLRITAKADVGFSPKNWEERPIPLARPLEQALKSHLATLPLRPPSSGSADGSNHEWLFPVYKGLRVIPEPTNLATSVATMRDVFRKAGFEPGMHRLRKSFATRLLNGGGSLAVVMRTCGWTQLETVQRYLLSDDDAARAAIDSL